MAFRGLLASIAVILAATLLPWSNFVGHAHWTQIQWNPFYSRQLDLFDIAANVARFAPFGFFAGGYLSAHSREKRIVWVLVAASLLSTLVEFVQIYSHGRFPSATDICSNVFGAMLGYCAQRGAYDASRRIG